MFCIIFAWVYQYFFSWFSGKLQLTASKTYRKVKQNTGLIINGLFCGFEQISNQSVPNIRIDMFWFERMLYMTGFLLTLHMYFWENFRRLWKNAKSYHFLLQEVLIYYFELLFQNNFLCRNKNTVEIQF